MKYMLKLEPMDDKKIPIILSGGYYSLDIAKIDTEKVLAAFPGTIRTITIIDYDDGSAVAMWDGDWD